MNKDFIKQQKTASLQQLEQIKDSQEGEKKKDMSIISQYLSSLLEPEKFNDAQKEDLRKLALELKYKEDTEFTEWHKTHYGKNS